MNNNIDSKTKMVCQVCGKIGHSALKCGYRFGHSYQAEDKRVTGSAVTVLAYNVDTNWYTDTGATNHITNDLDCLTTRERYTRKDQVHAANGAGMIISHIGNSMINTPYRNLHLKDVLHIPTTTKKSSICSSV